MKRREFLKISAMAGLGLAVMGCGNGKSATARPHYLEPDIGSMVDLEGEIIHVCPVDGMKMKLKLADGEIIGVVNANNTPYSKNEWSKMKIRVHGKLSMSTVSRETIASNLKEKKILCHIDHSPCFDEKWIANRWKDGSAEDMLKRDDKALQLEMRETKLNYVRVFKVTAERVELV